MDRASEAFRDGIYVVRVVIFSPEIILVIRPVTYLRKFCGKSSVRRLHKNAVLHCGNYRKGTYLGSLAVDDLMQPLQDGFASGRMHNY